MIINKSNFHSMPLFLQILSGHALSGYLFIIFGIWKISVGHPIEPSIFMAISGLYVGICGTLFTTRWKYSREMYMSIYFLYAILILATGANLFLLFVLFIIATPIAMYLYKKESVSDYLRNHHTR